jgi:hypothetical protein
MKQEEEEARNEDQADEIVLGEDGKITKLDKTENVRLNLRKVNSNTINDQDQTIITPEKLFQSIN